MFKVDLKALLQLSMSTEGPLLQHKRIKCDKGSYMLCYVLQDGYLTIRQAKVIRRGWRSKRLLRQMRMARACVADTQSTIDIMEASPSTKEADSQTTVIRYSHCTVDTMDLSLMISRQQQTLIQLFNSASCQTKHLQMETRSTQMVLELKSRWTETEVMPIATTMRSTQTLCVTRRQDNFTQTDFSSMSDHKRQGEERVFQLQERIVNLLLRSVNNQSNLLLNSVESINQLVEFKQLELVKQRLEKAQAQDAAKQAEMLKPKQRHSKRLNKRLHCNKFRIWARPAAKSSKQLQMQAHTQTERTITDTQTEQLMEKPVVLLAVAATQTDRLKGLSWLRISN
ncbi:uncharacterized protein LOC111593227 isoform X2 [Drosophila hydei]|uniref:Uncharacterized protein LOC111593227 isoform X2 n=1 Tax=Drosophila hydei TaxID=7224 RepID=A0A6J1LEG5_DROHY|nr:uncharacterized protein LOC111593227 isoform X2 [Drosophila hydei]